MREWAALFRQCYQNSILRYIFFGAMTTLVNLISFYLLRIAAGLPLQAANLASIVLAVLFAYVVNARYVFAARESTVSGRLRQFFRFAAARGVTMAVEVAGVWFTVEAAGMPDMWGKFLTQFLVLVLNYLFSRFFVFRNKKKGQEKQ